MRPWWAMGLLSAIGLGSACHRSGRTEQARPPAEAVRQTSAPPDAPAPLRTNTPFVTISVPGFRDAVVAVPQGATSPRPVLVAAHGMWDPPEGLCDNWRFVVRDRGWVLCPRGEPLPGGTFSYRGSRRLVEEVEAGVRALGARYEGYVDEGPLVYTGFSLGAVLAPWILAHHPARFPRAVLTEGGEGGFTRDAAQAFFRGGGQRVLFACGLRSRVPAATRTAALLSSVGVPSRVVLGKLPDAGQFIHWYNGPVADETRAQLDWLLEGDARWAETADR